MKRTHILAAIAVALTFALTVGINQATPPVTASDDTDVTVVTETYLNDKGEWVTVTTTTTGTITTPGKTLPEDYKAPTLAVGGGSESSTRTIGTIVINKTPTTTTSKNYPLKITADTYAPAGRTATLGVRKPGQDGFTTVTTARLGKATHPINHSTNTFTIPKPAKSGTYTYRIDVPAQGNHDRITSKTITIKYTAPAAAKKKAPKKTTVSLKAAKKVTTTKSGKPAKMKVVVSKAVGGKAVLQKKSGKKWVTVKTVKLPNKKGKRSATTITTPKYKKTGTYTYRVVVKPTSKITKGKATTFKVKVKKR